MIGLDATQLPYDFGVWYPLLGGGPIVRVDRHRAASQLDWHDIPVGRARLFVPGEPRSFTQTVCGALGTSKVKRRLARLPQGLIGDRFHLLPSTGGGYVLLSAKNAACYRAGIELLPAGRRRWRVARKLLRIGSYIGLTTPPGALDLAVVQHEAPVPSSAVSFAMRAGLAAVAGGVPGLNRKITLLFAAKHGLPARFAKISNSPASRIQIHHEIEALRTIADRFPGRGLAPRLIDDGEIGIRAAESSHSTAFLVQEAIGGVRPPDAIGSDHVRFLEQLHQRSLERRPLHEFDGFRRDGITLKRIARHADAGWTRTMSALASALQDFFGSRTIPCAYAHGDFTPWNTRIAHGALAAFDWEFFEPEAPALRDLFHYIVQTGVLVEHLDADVLFDRVISVIQGPARSLAEGALLPLHDVLGVFALYVLHIAVTDEAMQAIERPEFAQIDWLKSARVRLAQRLTTELRGLPRGQSTGAREAG